MQTNLTTEQIIAIATAAAVEAATAAVKAALVSAPVDLAEPATPVTAPVETAPAPAQELPVLTRAAWKSLRTPKGGKVRKAFAGMTREQAFEAGLCEGYRLPTGEMRAALRG